MTSGVWPRLARVALLVAVALLVIAAVSWSSVSTQLATEAARRRADWLERGAALRWNLGQPASLVIPGSFGVGAGDFRDGALAARFVTSDLDLSLATPAAGIPLSATRSAYVRLRSAHPLAIWLIATDTAGGRHEAPFTELTAGVDGRVMLPLPPSPRPGTVIDGLRLHLSGQPGRSVLLHDIELPARQHYDDTACPSSRDPGTTIARCAAAPARLVAPSFASPEALLQWRDRVHGSMLAVVEPPVLNQPTSAGMRHIASVAALLLASALLLTRWRRPRGRASEGVRPLDLILILPLGCLLWLGVGSPDTGRIEVVAFIVCSVALWLLRDPTSPALSWSSAAGWHGALWCTAMLSPLLLALLLANALDADGLQLRAIDADRLWFYPSWALLQQYLIMHVLAPRTRALVAGAGTGALLAGLLFALLHTPNFALMLATFIAGALWAWLGYRQRALLPLAASHAVCGLLLVVLAPDWLLRSAEIGGRYLLPP